MTMTLSGWPDREAFKAAPAGYREDIGSGICSQALRVVLDAYERPYDPTHPVVCVDEASKQVVIEW